MTNRPEKGDKAPKVTIPVSDEESVNLGAPTGAAHVVYFYPRDNTPGCTTESIDFSALKSDFEALDVQIIGVSKDSLKSHANFKTKKELTVLLASDENHDACEQFGVWVEKNMYGKKYMGIERSTFVILADGSIAEAWRKVKVKGHAQAVLDATRAILNG
ncbi:MAG: peroxiredoxin [Hyphomonadaceae bacterium]|nr:peroxiredoxin [Hyphomonadaceae bacterium]